MRKISNYKLKKSTEHLGYEIWMMYECLLPLVQFDLNQTEVNKHLDSFVIHARNLFNFFYPASFNIKKDDMLFSDYLVDVKQYNHEKTPKKDLKFIIKKADKQVSHLTYLRNKYSGRKKSWSHLEIGRKFKKTISAFFKSLPDNMKEWKVFELLRSI